jgi:thiosulfate dehydrogenase
MSPIAKALSVKESSAVADYYAGLDSASSTTTEPSLSAEAMEKGAYLALRGSWNDRYLPACEQCHGPGGSGIGDNFPALAGQHAGYIKTQLMDWKNNTRTTDTSKLMKSVADKLSSAEISAVASYYASLDPTKAGKAKAKDTAKLKPLSTKLTDKKGNYFIPPQHNSYPAGPFGESIRNGEAIYTLTNSNQTSADYVGNKQQCVNCHLNAGRLANSAPMWASWPAYPAYRKKNNKVNDMTMRIQGCFTYSMNAQSSKQGSAPAADSKPIIDLMAYMYWMSTGVPTGENKMAGRGYPKFKETKLGFDPLRGKKVYQASCATCHGDDGQGVVRNGETLFPPLWGKNAYNWGAGMHNVNKAAFFIKANMPLGMPNSLSEQQAWDVAAYINSHERPQDPRHKDNFEETVKKFHKGKYDYYGKLKSENGKLLGEDSIR